MGGNVNGGFDRELADGIMDEIFRVDYRRRTLRNGIGAFFMLALTFSVVLFGIDRSYRNTVNVRLLLEAPHAANVRVVGDFNGWEEPGLKMSKNDEGEWSAEIKVDPGTYRYLFLVDGKNMTDPEGITIIDPFGKEVSVVNADGEGKRI